MNILLIEDDKKKRKAIKGFLIKSGVEDRNIICAENMTDFTARISMDISLFIIDFKLPNFDDGAATQNGRAILESIIKAGKQDALLLAISSYPNDFPELRELYESHGCILADFANKDSWQSTLDHLLIQLKKNIRFEFLVFCALQEERNPYAALITGKNIVRAGVDCYDIELDGKKGTVILLPNMGLVNAAVYAGLCIERYRPQIVGMSGICGGFEKNAVKGQLLISSMVYEYQSGKWASDGFKHEPYQVATDHLTLTKLSALANEDNLLSELEYGFNGPRPPVPKNPEVAVFTSGSAVIADKHFLEEIKNIHRKVGGLDMEIFALQRAAELSECKPKCICAKTVVDLCDEDKNDDLHAYGSYISAKFMIKAISKLL
ncbi:nucleoside phosphorylase [Idiomarina sp. A28L]|uniref:phosphorylase family protein n=1 Tax=Idiomarina sp. A28L TaxID=1036674 RepID=UPI0002138A49|nr:nucleoside phosphorylase [Idiomarina sp. A28L]EGN74537.1 nucleoside phosphorylase [Idiomarina sp. A28L]